MTHRGGAVLVRGLLVLILDCAVYGTGFTAAFRVHAALHCDVGYTRGRTGQRRGGQAGANRVHLSIPEQLFRIRGWACFVFTSFVYKTDNGGI